MHFVERFNYQTQAMMDEIQQLNQYCATLKKTAKITNKTKITLNKTQQHHRQQNQQRKQQN